MAKRVERQQRRQGGNLTSIKSTLSMQVMQQVRRIETGHMLAGQMLKGRALSLTGAAEPPAGKRTVQLLGGIPARMHVPAQQVPAQQAQAMEVEVEGQMGMETEGGVAAPLLQPVPPAPAVPPAAAAAAPAAAVDNSGLVTRMLLAGALHDQELERRRAQQAARFGRR